MEVDGKLQPLRAATREPGHGSQEEITKCLQTAKCASVDRVEWEDITL
jgi:hypothetical protein